ncbi:MAG: glycoside hydrolase family 32 protein [Planctomycetes bacterium]|nr:glycoside hydrolase family 32 protein [Planctomycetota bacterium]
MRHHLLADPHRPEFHFVIPEGQVAPFDPNGGLFYNGRYHLFYIYQDEDRQHCFGHISSRDLFHWRQHPTVLAPKEGDADVGTFSGGAFLDKQGVPTIIYWGLGDSWGRGKKLNRPGGICLATSTDKNLDTWTKSPHNPVIPYPKQGDKEYERYTAVDPSAVWVKDGKYNVLTGNLQMMIEVHKNKPEFKKGDTNYLFQSDDLIHWTYKHEFYKSDRKWTAAFEDNMCPDFFPLGNKHMMLFISHTKGCQYYLGSYENDRFAPEQHGRMTWVDHEFFAPETILDDKGRRIMWAWVFDRNSVASQRAAGWAGLFSLPRVLTLGQDGNLRMNPPEELERLRYNAVTADDLSVPAGQEVVLDKVKGSVFELNIVLEPSPEAKQFGVVVARSLDGAEQTRVFYDATEKKLKIDTSKSGKEGGRKIEGGPLELAADEPLRLRVLVDKSVVDVFANDGRQAVCRRIYPSNHQSVGVAVFATGGPVKASKIKAWDIMPSNPY